MSNAGRYDTWTTGYDDRRTPIDAPLACPPGAGRANVCTVMNDEERALAPLLARAGILMFEYDRDGFLLSASGSCLGGTDPSIEVRAGLVTPSVVRLAAAGQVVLDEVRVADRMITVRHEPVRDASGETVKIVATAYDMSAENAAALVRSLPAAS